MLEPTKGNIIVAGLDTKSNMSKIYTTMGACPQYDLLWDNLTGREHLTFYGRIKNINLNELDNEINFVLRNVDLLNNYKCDQIVKSYR